MLRSLMSSWASRRRALTTAGALAATACQSVPPEEPPAPVAPPPGLQTSVRHFAGSALSGPQVVMDLSLIPAEPARALALHATLALLERLPDATSSDAPIVDHLRLVAEPTDRSVVRAPSRLTIGGRLARGDAARSEWSALTAEAALRGRLLADESAALLDGTTTALVATCTEPFDDPDDFLHEHASPTSLSSTFVVDVRRLDAIRADVMVELGARELRCEVVKLNDELVADGEPLLLMFPSPFHGGEGRACAAFLELARPPKESDAHARAVEQALADVRRESDAALASVRVERAATPQAQALTRALRELEADASMRPTLVYLTTTTQAPLAAELALVASDADLVAFLQRIVNVRTQIAEGSPAATVDESAVGWLLERAAWRFVAATAMESELAPEIRGIVFQHGGAVSAFPTLLEEAADGSGDLAAFTRRLADENRLLLEETSAAARVRAFDWLKARGLAPKEFDPLATPEQRRAALAAESEPGHE